MAEKRTLVVNLFAGPGAGKTTCAWLIAGALKKQNIETEYVPEYAKELVWDGNTELLDGTFVHQSELLHEQNRRIERLVGKVDVVVTDSPIILGAMYIKEQREDFNAAAMVRHNRYNNFNLFVNRGAHFEQSGRIHNLQESRAIDTEVKDFLKCNDVYYGTYSHDRLDTVVNNIQTTLRKLQARGNRHDNLIFHEDKRKDSQESPRREETVITQEKPSQADTARRAQAARMQHMER